ncbi:hypothetical protein RM780_03905 [Streptomyces sp. DSM 44917]|uniref:Uncharacterized protein n=1 Tax=Streptomyces boetiae TaxID=3075541 RepID=A0ABU2L3G3_9ACTN|nr:hypothetical protein [Streptomyces sp. DSM 44917]MDT0306107.1 hypothetical protein [Streptomyces sp. DSM 44917]
MSPPLDLVAVAGAVARRLDGVHPAMLPLLTLIATAATITAVPLVALTLTLACLRRAAIATANWQPRRRVPAPARAQTGGIAL